jgi:hypothetical protein
MSDRVGFQPRETSLLGQVREPSPVEGSLAHGPQPRLEGGAELGVGGDRSGNGRPEAETAGAWHLPVATRWDHEVQNCCKKRCVVEGRLWFSHDQSSRCSTFFLMESAT